MDSGETGSVADRYLLCRAVCVGSGQTLYERMGKAENLRAETWQRGRTTSRGMQDGQPISFYKWGKENEFWDMLRGLFRKRAVLFGGIVAGMAGHNCTWKWILWKNCDDGILRFARLSADREI